MMKTWWIWRAWEKTAQALLLSVVIISEAFCNTGGECLGDIAARRAMM